MSTYSAELAVLHDHPGRTARRRLVNFIAHVRDVGAEIASIRVTDLSTDGCKFSCDRPLEEATEIWLRISGIGARWARIVWSKEGEFGCEFLSPLDHATVDELAAGAYEAMRKKRAARNIGRHRT